MANTPDMNLPVPEPGVTPAPNWGQQQQTAMGLIDAHDHTNGKGVQVPVAGLDINDDLGHRGYAIYDVSRLQLLPQSSETGNDSVYVRGVDLYYRDGNGNEVQLTTGGHVNAPGGGGGTGISGLIPVGTIGGLRSIVPSLINSSYLYATNGYATAGDMGAALYWWDPNETRADDGCFCIAPNGAGPSGRFKYRLANGVYDFCASPAIVDVTLDYGLTLEKCMKDAESFGCNTILLPPWRLIMSPGWAMLQPQTTDPRVAISNVKLKGRPGKSILCGLASIETKLATVRLASTVALPSCTASGAGAGKTLTATANGTLTIDTKLCALSDRIGIFGQTALQDNGVYVVTQAGDGSHPWILTRATDLNQSKQLQCRLGVRASDGNTNINTNFVLTNLPGAAWTDGYAFTIDNATTGKQYWTVESYAQGIIFGPVVDVVYRLFRGFQPSKTNQNWTTWTSPGQMTFNSVNGLAGGPWTDPSTGTVYQASPTVQGTKWIVDLGGTPSDQGGSYQVFKCQVKQIDASNNVTIDRPVPLKNIYTSSTSTGTNNPPYSTANMYPTYGLNQSQHYTDNTYCVILQDSNNLSFEDIIFDGISPSFTLVDNIFTKNCEIRNAHLGIQYFGCGTHRNENLKYSNMTPYSFQGATSYPNTAYGYAFQSINSTDGVSYGTTGIGVSVDFCDFESETEERFVSTDLILKPYDVFRTAHNIANTTPNVLKSNIFSEIRVRGTTDAPANFTQPASDLTWEVFDTSGNPLGLSAISGTLSGRLSYKGRRYQMDSRRPWYTTISLGPSQNKFVTRPFTGLWANTKIYRHGPISGVTSLLINDAGGSFFGNWTTALLALPADQWVWWPWDGLAGNYPNWYNGEYHYMQIITDVTQPTGSYIVIATDVIAEQGRGDGYTTVSTLTTDVVPGVGAFATLEKVTPDIGPLMTLIGTAAPAITPYYQGQRFIDTTAGAIYEAIDTVSSADWKKLTP